MTKSRAKSAMRFYLRLIVNLLIIFLMIKLFTFSYGFAYKVFVNQPYNKDSAAMVVVHINKGTSTFHIGETLEENNVIESKYAFVIRAKFSKYNGQLKEGAYEVSAAMSMDEILSILSQQTEEEKEE